MRRPETLQKKYVGKLSKRALSFMKALLQMDPADRLTSRECIENAYFEALDMRSQVAGGRPDTGNPGSVGRGAARFQLVEARLSTAAQHPHARSNRIVEVLTRRTRLLVVACTLIAFGEIKTDIRL